MRTINKLLTILFLTVILITNLQAQNEVIILLKQPPPNQLGIGDLWNLELNNTTDRDLKIYVKGTVTEENEGLIIEGKSKVFTVKAGKTNYKYKDFSNAEVKYNNSRYKEIITRTGNAPEGNYTICVTAYSETGETVSLENCISQSVKITGRITLISPVDGEKVDSKLPVIFSWTPLQGTSTYRIKIVEVSQNQSVEEAMSKNKAFFEQSGIKMTSFEFPTTKIKFEEGKKYAWVVLNDEGTIRSEIIRFTYGSSDSSSRSGVGAIKKFTMASYEILVTSPSGTFDDFSGTGTIELWQGGPVLDLTFSNLRMISYGTNIWVCSRGDIRQQYNNIFTLPSQHGNGSFFTSEFHIYQDGNDWDNAGAEFVGYIEWNLPLAVNGSNIIKSVTGVLFVTYQSKIRGTLGILQDYDFTLVDPLGFNLLISRNDYSSFFVGGSYGNVIPNGLECKFSGQIKLPANTPDIAGNRIAINFTDVRNLVYFAGNTTIQNSQGIRLIPNTNISIEPTAVIVDFSETQSPTIYNISSQSISSAPGWKGVWFNTVRLNFPVQISNNNNDLRMSQANSFTLAYSHNLPEVLSCYVTSTGLSCMIVSYEEISRVAIYKTFSSTLRGIKIINQNGIISNSHLGGDLKILLLKEPLEYEIPINQNGLADGFIRQSSLGEKVIYSTTINNKLRKLFAIVEQAVFVGNEIKMKVHLGFSSGKFTFNTSSGVGGIGKLTIPDLYVRSDGMVNPGNIVSPNWYDLPGSKTAKLAGFTVSVSKIRITYVPQTQLYKIGFKGTITLANNLGTTSGGISAEIENWINAPAGGPLSYNKFKVNDLCINFDNPGFKFLGCVTFYEDDAIYGDGFKGTLDLTIKKPYFAVNGTLYIGIKTPENYKYWFVQAGVAFNPGIDLSAVGVPIQINGFTGRAYYKMKPGSNPWNVTSTNFVPDNGMTYGIMALIPLSLTAESEKFWGNTAYVMSFNTSGSISQMTFYADAYLMSSGFGQTNGKAKLSGSIGYYAPPVVPNQHFLGTLSANVGIPNINLANMLCANGTLSLYIRSSNDWYFNIGSKLTTQLPGSKITSKLFCQDKYQGNSYFMLNPQNILAGTGAQFNSGEQTINIWTDHVEGYYNYGFNLNSDFTLNYSPFQTSASISISGNANCGFKYRIRKNKPWNNKKVLNGQVGANLQFMFPNPTCIAGKVKVSTSLPIGTYSFDAKIKWSNGVFSKADTCP